MKRIVAALLFSVLCYADASYASIMYEEVSLLRYDESLDGQTFDWRIQDSNNDWYVGAYGFSFVLPLGWNEAYLSLILGGAGRTMAPQIFLNNIYLGDASIGDGEALGTGMNVYRLDTWQLSEEAVKSLVLANLLDIKVGDTDGWSLEGINFAGFRDTGGSHPAAPVPEPATMLLFSSGIAGIMALRRKKHR